MLQNWRIYGYLYFKTKMGLAGLIFEPYPPYFKIYTTFEGVEMTHLAWADFKIKIE